jgi:hypothetical protein
MLMPKSTFIHDTHILLIKSTMLRATRPTKFDARRITSRKCCSPTTFITHDWYWNWYPRTCACTCHGGDDTRTQEIGQIQGIISICVKHKPFTRVCIPSVPPKHSRVVCNTLSAAVRKSGLVGTAATGMPSGITISIILTLSCILAAYPKYIGDSNSYNRTEKKCSVVYLLCIVCFVYPNLVYKK